MHAAIRRACTAVFAVFVLCLAFSSASYAQEAVPVPRLAARVTDLTGLLSPDERAGLEAKLAQFETRKGAQIAVLILPTTQPETIEQYARRVADEWKLGRKGVDDGALLVIAMQDRKLRIETQYGLEGVLPDAVAKRIISDTIAPRFRAKDFHGGIVAGIDRMIGVIDGEPLPPPPAASQDGPRSGAGPDTLEALLLVGFVLVFVVGGILRAMMGRVGGAAVTGAAGGAIAWFIAGSAIAVGIVGVAVFLFSLLIGAAGLRNLGGGRGSWGGGGWSSGGGGWSGGGGGWSGGGGSGGGGGASGDW